MSNKPLYGGKKKVSISIPGEETKLPGEILTPASFKGGSELLRSDSPIMKTLMNFREGTNQ